MSFLSQFFRTLLGTPSVCRHFISQTPFLDRVINPVFKPHFKMRHIDSGFYLLFSFFVSLFFSFFFLKNFLGPLQTAGNSARLSRVCLPSLWSSRIARCGISFHVSWECLRPVISSQQSAYSLPLLERRTVRAKASRHNNKRDFQTVKWNRENGLLYFSATSLLRFFIKGCRFESDLETLN